MEEIRRLFLGPIQSECRMRGVKYLGTNPHYPPASHLPVRSLAVASMLCNKCFHAFGVCESMQSDSQRERKLTVVLLSS